MTNYVLERADKDLFAVYQTIYSQSDIEMWYDWNARLSDTKWSDDGYFLCCDGEKIGGAIIAPNLVMYAFISPPFCDRRLFWKLVLGQAVRISTETEIQLKGVLASEVDTLLSYGAEIWRLRQIMCRPTDRLSYVLDGDFCLETPVPEDIPEIADVERASFIGGIAYRKFGEDSTAEIAEGLSKAFERYTQTDSLNQMVISREKSTSRIVGACIAGINPKMPNLFAGIDDVFVLPGYRGRGLAEAMIKHSITAAHPRTPVCKLHVLVGNPAENLYRKLGFVAGPRFTDMKYRNPR